MSGLQWWKATRAADAEDDRAAAAQVQSAPPQVQVQSAPPPRVQGIPSAVGARQDVSAHAASRAAAVGRGSSTVVPRGIIHLEGVGDTSFTHGVFSGTRGQSRRLEGFMLRLDPPIAGVNMQYMAHLEGIGDTPWVNEGQFVGTRGRGRRMEGFAFRLTGPEAARYTVVYMAHLQDTADTGFYRDSQYCGTRGQSRRVEGIQVRVMPR
jgi:hypothetical protein